jgi:hypothetical protein
MLHRIHDRFGAAGVVIAVIALVAALGGTALAAKGALTGKQKKEVEKIAKKFAGKQGPVGPQGLPGANGTNGKDGTNGLNGAPGKSVVTGTATGAECPSGGTTVEVEGSGVKNKVCNGKEGSPWTAGGTLPSGQTETGSWAAGVSTKNTFVPLSFTIPLAATMDESQVHYINAAKKEVIFTEAEEFEEVNPTKCLGSAEEPTAVSGNLCVYAAFQGASAHIASQFILKAGDPTSIITGTGASTAGARLFVVMTGETSAGGTWAVTAGE